MAVNDFTYETESQVKFNIICLFEWTPSQRKEVDIPLGILPHVWEQKKCSYFPRLGQS